MRVRWHVGCVVVASVVAGCGEEPDPPPAEIGCPGEPLPATPGLDPALEARVDALVAAMTLDEQLAQLTGAGAPVDELWTTAGVARLGVPGFRMTDGPRGVYKGASTAFPVAMARGATFDVALEEAIGEAIGREAAGHGADVILAPTVNILRHPAWGRAQETYGEDVHHLGAMGAAFVTGAQRHVIATAKHFAANSIEDTRYDVDVSIDERALREVYLPHFERLVREAQVGAVMTAYNSVNGAYASQNPVLVRQILKGEWGFPGVVMSDWVFGTHDGAAAIQAGLDLEMPWPIAFGGLRDAVASCAVPRAAVDDAVRRIVRTQLRFGLDAGLVRDPGSIESPAHAALARRAAQESIVLLKNARGALPVEAGAGPIVVVGALADLANLGDDGSSDVHPTRAASPLAGMRARYGAGSVLAMTTDTPTAGELDAIGAARAAVVVVGLTSADEGENLPDRGGDRESLALPAAQQALIAAVAARNPRTIVVVEAGSAVLTAPWIDAAAAVLYAWYPGQEGGHALADLIAGDVAPSGRLPLSLPVAEADLPPFDHTSLQVTYGMFHGYRWLDREGRAPAFPFGFGLSYGTVDYEALRLDASRVARDGTIGAQVQVRSVDRTGAEVVQLYVEPPAGASERAVRDLRGFARVEVRPGEPTLVRLEVPIRALARWDVGAHAWVIDPGTYTIAVGRDARDLPLRAQVTIE